MRQPLKTLCALVAATTGAFAATCHISPSDPQYETYAHDVSKHVPGWEVVNLDLPPAERWTKIVAPKAKAIQGMIDAFKNSYGKVVGVLLTILEKVFGGVAEKLLDALPAEYAGEIKGIQNATGISAVDLFVYNIMYELSGACTSVVAQDASGNIIHGRNLDFGPAELTAKLLPLLVRIQFMKNGVTLFNSTSYAGYVGCLTCIKEGAFSLSVDTRLWSTLPGPIPLPGGLIDWITGRDRSGQFLTFMTRDAFQQDGSFAEAVQRANSSQLLGPSYLIVAGVKAGEGAIITRDSKHSLHYWSLADEVASKNRPFILETNYDHWDGKSHDRRDNGNACMEQIVSSGNVDFKNLFQVMSSKPNRNDGTTYTSLLSPRDGRMESYIQHCCNDTALIPGIYT